jgi:hypothetical protein
MELSHMSKTSLVVIGCKHPTGLILELGKLGEDGYKKYVVAGANQGDFRADGLLIPRTIGGFGRTTIPRDFWEAWSKQNSAIAKEWQEKGFLFVADDNDLASAQANEKAAASTGFEALRTNGKGELDDKRAKAAAPDITANPDFAATRVA